MTVGLVHGLKRTATLLALGLLIAACSSNGQTAPSLPNPTEDTPATDATDDIADETIAEAAETTAPPDSSANTTTPAEDFTPATVSFDPENPPDQQTVEDLAFAAVEADFKNLLWCMQHVEDCDLDRHIAPAVAQPRRTEIRQVQDQMRADGGLYEPSEIDGIYRVEVLVDSSRAFDFGDDNSFRLLGAVSTCEVFGGPYYVPGADGSPARIIDDDQVSYLAEYRVWQNVDGVLKVAGRSYDEPGAVEECDAFKS